MEGKSIYQIPCFSKREPALIIVKFSKWENFSALGVTFFCNS